MDCSLCFDGVNQCGPVRRAAVEGTELCERCTRLLDLDKEQARKQVIQEAALEKSNREKGQLLGMIKFAHMERAVCEKHGECWHSVGERYRLCFRCARWHDKFANGPVDNP